MAMIISYKDNSSYIHGFDKPRMFFFLGLVFLFLLFALKYLWVLAAPFIMGFFAAGLLEPLVQRIKNIAHWPRKIAARLIFFSFTLVFGIAVILFAWRLFGEIKELLAWLQQNQVLIRRWVIKITANIQQKDLFYMAEVRHLLDGLFLAVCKVLRDAISGMPQFFLVLFLSILTTFFILDDKEKIASSLAGFFPDGFYRKMIKLEKEVFSSGLAFIRIQIVLGFVSFIYTWFILWMFNVPKCFLWGLVSGAFDLIPLAGPSVAFIPWAIYFFLEGSWGKGLVICLALITLLIARQILEPKLVGESMGLHPLFALMALYIGVKIYGVAGVLFGPLILIILRVLYKGFQKAGTTFLI